MSEEKMKNVIVNQNLGSDPVYDFPKIKMIMDLVFENEQLGLETKEKNPIAGAAHIRYFVRSTDKNIGQPSKTSTVDALFEYSGGICRAYRNDVGRSGLLRALIEMEDEIICWLAASGAVSSMRNYSYHKPIEQKVEPVFDHTRDM